MLESIHAIHPTSEDSYSDLRLWSLLVSLYPSVCIYKEESSLLWWKNKTHQAQHSTSKWLKTWGRVVV